MLGLSQNLKIFASTQPCDMRKQAQGLLALVESISKREPQVAELYLFWNRNKDMIKVVYLDDNGACIFSKRLHRGRFRLALPTSESEDLATIRIEVLTALIAAVDCLHRPPRTANKSRKNHKLISSMRRYGTTIAPCPGASIRR